MTELTSGSKAPAFKLNNQDETPVSLAGFKGQKVILYFYPAASTPGCTKQACDFQENMNVLKKAGYAVVGISPDAPAKLTKFRKAEGLKFDLLSDPEMKVIKAYGAFGEKSMYGKIYEGLIRSTFVIDEKGKIEHALYNVKATGHVAMLRKVLEI
ncbi:MAG: thioredoxin-dependent thiol peroxidase [Actinobacteria bacterium]|nr:thioredoxin-dependent thiol peroxidase [Actinomycetota bacterium]NBY43650.1 thioredoxin-dependent thiol peroxidase [Micrococcales bacterium]